MVPKSKREINVCLIYTLYTEPEVSNYVWHFQCTHVFTATHHTRSDQVYNFPLWGHVSTQSFQLGIIQDCSLEIISLYCTFLVHRQASTRNLETKARTSSLSFKEGPVSQCRCEERRNIAQGPRTRRNTFWSQSMCHYDVLKQQHIWLRANQPNQSI